MRILLVTPLLPYPQAANAGPLVMYDHLTTIAARHDVTVATFAGPDPCEWQALADLRAAGIAVRALWREKPSPIMRRWRILARLLPMPDPAEWNELDTSNPSTRNPLLPRSSPVTQLQRRLQQADYWLSGTRPLRTLQFWDPRMQRLIQDVLAEKTFELIDIHDNAMANYRYGRGVPTLFTEHDVRHNSSEEPHRPLSSAGWVQSRIREADLRRWGRYQPIVWRRFDRIQVFSARDAQAICNASPDLIGRVHVNPFGIHLPKAADPSRQENGTLVFVGGFCHPPNVDAALWLAKEIMPLIRVRRPDARLVIVGSSPPQEVRSLRGQDISVTGRVPAVEPYLERAAVVLAPVRYGGGMRLKVLQAMGMGKAVVTTPIGAEGLEVGTQQVPLVIANDPEGIANAAIELLGDDSRRRALGDRARGFIAEHHNWATYAQRLESIYSELVQGSR